MTERKTARSALVRGWLLAAIAGVTALLLAALAIATNVGTELLPDWPWTQDPSVVWSVVGVLLFLVAALAVIQQRLAGSTGGQRNDEVSNLSVDLRNTQISGGLIVASNVSNDVRADDHPPSRGLPNRNALKTLGRAISELDGMDALTFEVHHAVSVDGYGELPVLPQYISRPHDDHLRQQLRLGLERSFVVILVGASSTGKTRACWEAIIDVMPHWKVWHPLVPERPEAVVAALESNLVGPQTVIWLNEAQLYLSPLGVGERVASALQQLISDPSRGPVVIVGSMWPPFWSELTDPDTKDHPAARALLQGRDIAVPASFSEEDLDAVRSQRHIDPRISIAMTTSDGRITQFLAGVPELITRYKQADDVTRAVIWAAIDVRRLSRAIYLPKEFLRLAAPGYVARSVWEQIEDKWFDVALAYLLRPRHGVSGPLSTRKPLPEEDADGRSDPDAAEYRLADYLEQVGRAERANQCPPPSFWYAAGQSISDYRILSDLAEAATRRGRLARAFQLHRASAALGNNAALEVMAWIRENAGDLEGAEDICREAVGRGDAKILLTLALIQYKAGNIAGAELTASEMASRGSTAALRALARRLTNDGQVRMAQTLLKRQARLVVRTDDLPSLSQLSDSLCTQDPTFVNGLGYAPRTTVKRRAGSSDSSREESRSPASPAGFTSDSSELASATDVSHAERSRLPRGPIQGIEGHGSLNVGSATQPAADDSLESLMTKAWRHRKSGRLADARRCYREALDSGEQAALRALVELYEHVDDIGSAQRLIRYGIDDGGSVSMPW